MPARQVLLIFGGALNFSLALARQAAALHWCVALASRDEQQEAAWLDALSSIECERMFIKSRLEEEFHFRQVLERVQRRWGQVDIVVNLAIAPCLGLFETSNDDDWQWTFEHNLLAVARGCKATISLMKRQGHGRLLNITTQAARLPQPSLAITSSLQGAVVSLSEALQAEMAPLNIRVQLACVDFFPDLFDGEPRAQTPLDAARFERLQNHTLTVDQVAKAIFTGIKGKDFLILTHSEGRSLWWRYRLSYAKWLARGRELAERLRPERRFLRDR